MHLKCIIGALALGAMSIATESAIAKNTELAPQRISNELVDSTNLNMQNELVFDHELGKQIPMLAPAINRMLVSNNAYFSTKFEPYVNMTLKTNEMTGETTNGDIYKVLLTNSYDGVTASFSINGVRKYRFETQKSSMNSDGRMLHSVLYDISNPNKDVVIDVYKTDRSIDGNPVARLSTRFAGKEVSEDVWPGKQNFQNIDQMAAMMASMSREENSLNNFFYLLSSNPQYNTKVWQSVQQFSGKTNGSQSNYLTNLRNPGVKPMMISNQDYWCAIGTIGADVVFTLAGSFGYGVVCGLLAE